MSTEDVLGNGDIPLLVRFVGEHEYHVETGHECGRQIDLLGNRGILLEPTVLGVRGCEHGASALERGRDTGLCDRDLL